jgi:hypothetical protein
LKLHLVVRWGRWLVILTLATFTVLTNASVWTVQDRSGRPVTQVERKLQTEASGLMIAMDGVIIPGDGARLVRIINERGFGAGMRVHLNSPGGDVNESYAIGRILRRYQSVVTHGVCASACVFSYLGGSKRITKQSVTQGPIGSLSGLVIHQPEGTNKVRSIDTPLSAALMRELRNYTIEMLRGPAFFEIMVNVPFNSPTLLSTKDALELNVATELAN